jgi:branched-chain amino acid transport system permease protein
MGINLFQTKLLAFFMGSFMAGIAGWLWAYFMGHITPLQFDFKLSLMFLGMVIVGGMGSTTGAIFGSVILRLMEKLVDYISAGLSSAFPGIAVQIFPAMSLIVFAAVVMFFIMVEPRGAYHRFQRFQVYYRLHPFSF